MAKSIITCQLTGSIGPAINAQVIPRSFYKFNGDGQMIQLCRDSYRKRRSPIGIYDQTIVTQEGEDQFRDCDNYGAEFFVRNFDSKPWKILSGDNPATSHGKILEPGEFNSDMIRRLCMTILWRAHASCQDFFKRIDIGPHEDRLRNFILTGQLGDPGDFSIFLFRWDDTFSAPTLVPRSVKIEGINYIEFKTSVIQFLIKVDKRLIESNLLNFAVGGDTHLAVFQRKFFDSKDGRILIPLLRKHKSKGL